MLKKLTLPLCAALLAAPVPAIAADAAAPGTAKELTPEQRAAIDAQLDMGANVLAALMGGMQSDQVPDSVKNALFICMYDQPIKAISAGAAKVIKEREALSADKPNDVFNAAVIACGIEIIPADQAEAADGSGTSSAEQR